MTTCKDCNTVTFILDGIPFTGIRLREYTVGGIRKTAVKVTGYAVGGRFYEADSDDSAVQVDSELIVGEVG